MENNKKKSVRILNGYRVIYKPDHPSSMTNDNWKGYVYEHIYLVEKNLNMTLRSNEVVHHMDGNRSNNRLNNLLVLLRSQHSKLHDWIDRGSPYLGEIEDESVVAYCEVCGTTLQEKQKRTCSKECAKVIVDKESVKPNVEELIELKKTMSREAIGRHYGVSGNAVKKWEKGYGIFQPRQKK